MNVDQLATKRYTTKAYDPHKRVGAAQMEQLKTLLRFAPSSVNSQPWHFVIAESNEAKQRIAAATTGPYGANEPKVVNASHVLVLCARTELDDTHLEHLLAREKVDGRFPDDDSRLLQGKVRAFYVDMHRNELGDTQHWMEKQVYLAHGMLLLGAASLEIDATPIEGFDREVLDHTLGLPEKGLRSVVLTALGYRSDDDFNAELPKSRLPQEEVLTQL